MSIWDLLHFARGDISTISLDNKFGRNADVDAAEDIWLGGGDYTGFPLTDDEAVEVFSGDANDTSAGTGARTVKIWGLDSNFADQNETITLSGATPVDSVNTYRRVFRAAVMTAGSGAANAGVITVRHTTTTANVFATIGIGDNQTLVACTTVPAGKTLYINNVFAAGAQAQQGIQANIGLRTREPGGVFRLKRIFGLADTSPISIQLNAPLVCPPQTDIKLRVESISAVNGDIVGAFDFLLDTN